MKTILFDHFGNGWPVSVGGGGQSTGPRYRGYRQPRFRLGFPSVSTYPACAQPKFGDGRLGEVRRAAGIPVGIEGNPVEIAAFALEADSPAFLR